MGQATEPLSRSVRPSRARSLLRAVLIGCAGLPFSGLVLAVAYVVPSQPKWVDWFAFVVLFSLPLVVSISAGVSSYFAAVPTQRRAGACLRVPAVGVGFGVSVAFVAMMVGGGLIDDVGVGWGLTLIVALVALKSVSDLATSWSGAAELPLATAAGLWAGAVSLFPAALVRLSDPSGAIEEDWLALGAQYLLWAVPAGTVGGVRLLQSTGLRPGIRVAIRAFAGCSSILLAVFLVLAVRMPTAGLPRPTTLPRGWVELGLAAVLLGPVVGAIGWWLGYRERARDDAGSPRTAYRDAPPETRGLGEEAAGAEYRILTSAHLELVAVAIVWLGVSPLLAAACYGALW